MKLTPEQFLRRADGLGIDAHAEEQLRTMTVPELRSILETCAAVDLISRAEILQQILRVNQHRLDAVRDLDLFQRVVAFAPHDLESQRLLIDLGLIGNVTVTELIYRLQQETDIRNSVCLPILEKLIKCREKERFSAEESIAFVSLEFKDKVGQRALLTDRQYATRLTWNMKPTQTVSQAPVQNAVHALISTSPDLANWLIDTMPEVVKSFSVNASGLENRTLLQSAIHSGSPSLVRKVLALCLQIPNFTQWLNRQDLSSAKKPALFDASLSASYNQLVRPLIDLGADVKALDGKGRTVLQYVYAEGAKTPALMHERLRELVICGIPVDVRDHWGRTLLMVAASRRDLETMAVLLELDADPAAIDTSHRTLTDYVLMTEDSQFVRKAEKLLPKKRRLRLPKFSR